MLGREIERVEEKGGGGGGLERLLERKRVFERVLEEMGKEGEEGKEGGERGRKGMEGRDCFGKTPLHLAAMGGWVWIVGRLLVVGGGGGGKGGGMVGGRDNDGLSVLHSLCSTGGKGLGRGGGGILVGGGGGGGGGRGRGGGRGGGGGRDGFGLFDEVVCEGAFEGE